MVTASGARWEVRYLVENQWCPAILVNTKKEKAAVGRLRGLAHELINRHYMGSSELGEYITSFYFF